MPLVAHPRIHDQPKYPFAVRFGRNLARLREKHGGLTQEELGMRAELHRTAVGQLERGERTARADTLLKLAGSLGVSTEEFFKGIEYEPSVRTVGLLKVAEDEEQPEP
ncbi:MAG: helix-turn-helix domain-containing protein [Solirubrobacterales bacterium]